MLQSEITADIKEPSAGSVSHTVTIVICTYNRPESLERCLRSLATLDYTSFKAVVIDNAPAAANVRHISEQFNVGYRAEAARGLSKARNTGLRIADTDFIAFLDDDMIAHPCWLSSLMSKFSTDSVVAVTGPMLPMQLAGAPDERLSEAISRHPWGNQPINLNRNSDSWFERATFGGIGDGNFALRRSALEGWRGFEERIGRGKPIDIGEEHLAFLELIERLGTIVYSPDAIVFHGERAADSLGDLSQGLAFAGFVALQRPLMIPRLVKFFLRGLSGKSRSWQTWESRPAPKRRGATTLMRALVRAIPLISRACREK